MGSDVAIEDLLPRAGMSTYRLVRMAARRALELSDGKTPLIEGANVNTQKLTSIALKEIAGGKVTYKYATPDSKEFVKTKPRKDAKD